MRGRWRLAHIDAQPSQLHSRLKQVIVALGLRASKVALTSARALLPHGHMVLAARVLSDQAVTSQKIRLHLAASVDHHMRTVDLAFLLPSMISSDVWYT